MINYHKSSHGEVKESGIKGSCSAGGERAVPAVKLNIFMAIICGITIVIVPPATSIGHSHVNSPPILVIPDRNWRISETEQVGQVISRIRADDSENDELVYGLEPAYTGTNNPFRIDPVNGIVYINETLVGRGGENFFLYITVTDGLLTAKNEVYVNILSTKENNNGKPRSTIVHNMSHFLPSFDRLPGVQSIRNQHPNSKSSNILPAGFHNVYPQPVLNFNPYQPIWQASNDDNNGSNLDNHYGIELSMMTTQATAAATSRIKLTPITHYATTFPSSKNTIRTQSPGKTNSSSTNGSSSDGESRKKHRDDSSLHTKYTSTIFYGLKLQIIPLLLIFCALLVTAAVIVAILYRKRLCTFGKTLQKKSKEEIDKKSNKTNLSINLTDDNRNSIVMQHWNGPMAYGNRYVPWERDQQSQQNHLEQQKIMQQPMLPTCGTNDGISTHHPALFEDEVGETTPDIECVRSGDRGLLASAVLTPQEKHDPWEFPRYRLKFFNILGEGAFGQVWRCEATDIEGNEGITTVAVKTLKENATEGEKKDLLSELEVMKSLEPHVNVVRLLGCCTDKDPIFVIIEYVKSGKLQTYLRSSRAERHYGNTHGKSNILTSADLTSFMYQVAKGMDYLTSRGIIHRDLAARNILIGDDHTCKVADFGFARDVITSKVYERKSEGKLPIRWMAIESLYDNIFSAKSDIWSFGILMWEIVTLGSTPYPGIAASDVMRKVRDGYRLEKPEHCRRELYNIMYYCWSQDPTERPSFADLVQMLDKLLHTEMDYIELERFPDHNYYNIISLSGEKV